MTSQEERGIAHYVDLTKLDLLNNAGERVSIKNMFADFTLNSSIFEYFMHGHVVVYDAVGLINRLPIIGEETLEVEYATPGNTPKKMTFRVWKVTDEHPDEKGASSTYLLHFCSAEAFQNAFRLVGKSFTNTDDSASILKTVLTDYLKSQKPFNTTTMKDPAKRLVIPNYKPFEAIDMLLRRGYAGNPSKTDYFLFFERSDGFYLRMIDDLVSKPINLREQGQGVPNPGDTGGTPDTPPTSVETYYAYASMKYQGDSVGDAKRAPRDIRRIVTYKAHQRFDSLQKIREGLYENEVVQYSIMEKKLQSVVYKFQQKKVLLLGGSPGPNSDYTRGTGNEPMNTDHFMSEFNTPTSKFRGDGASKVFYRLLDPEEKDGVVKKSGWLYQSMRVALSQVQISITVPGDTMVDCGDVVYLEVPRFDSTTYSHEPDKFLCGKYVVGSLRDSILSPDRHVMVLDLFRDSFWKRPGASDFATSAPGTQS
jgi:hypothetical protein